MRKSYRLAAMLAALCLLAPASVRAQAKDDCTITYSADEAMSALIAKEKFNQSYYDDLCPWLAANGLELGILNDNGVLTERAFAWVSAGIVRAATRVTGTRTSKSTVVREEGTDEAAYEAMREALDSALSALTTGRDEHLRALVAEEKLVRRAP